MYASCVDGTAQLAGAPAAGWMVESAPGRVEFLHKPFSPEMLAKAVRRLLASKEENV